MEKDNAIIIILLILIVLSAGVYIIITGAGISFTQSEGIGQANYTINNTTVNTTDDTLNETRDTGIYDPNTYEGSASDSYSYSSDSSYDNSYSNSYSYSSDSYSSQDSQYSQTADTYTPEPTGEEAGQSESVSSESGSDFD